MTPPLRQSGLHPNAKRSVVPLVESGRRQRHYRGHWGYRRELSLKLEGKSTPNILLYRVFTEKKKKITVGIRGGGRTVVFRRAATWRG